MYVFHNVKMRTVENSQQGKSRAVCVGYATPIIHVVSFVTFDTFYILVALITHS